MKKLIILCVVAAVAGSILPAAGGMMDAGLSVRGAYVLPAHDFRRQLSPGYGAGLGMLYPLYSLSRYLAVEGDVSAVRWPLEKSGGSSLSSFSAGAGPLVLLPTPLPVTPYAGCSIQAVYFFLNADRLGENETALRPGISARTGIFSDLAGGVGVRAGAEYTAVPLSGKVFGTWGISLALMMNHEGLLRGSRAANERGVEAEVLYVRARRELEAGNAGKARPMLERVLRIDGSHDGARKDLAEIARLEALHAKADALLKDKKYMDALPALDEASTGLKEAAEKLARVRALLQPNVPLWEKAGIDEYEKKNYDGCILYMEKILMVEPDNKTARIYLPRARNRKEALERLR